MNLIQSPSQILLPDSCRGMQPICALKVKLEGAMEGFNAIVQVVYDHSLEIVTARFI